MKRLILFLLLMTSMAFGQTTTYTGTIKDLAGNPVTSGMVTFTLSPATDSTIPGTGRFVPTMISCNINADGTLSGYAAGTVSGPCIVVSNISLSPAGTSYRICEQPYFATPGSCFYDYATTSSKDISSVAPTLATGPLNYGGVLGPQGIQGPMGPAGTTTANGSNGSFNVPGQLWASSLKTTTPTSVLGSTFFGDSICVGTGTTSPIGPNGSVYYVGNTMAWASLLGSSVGGPLNNYCYGGSMTADAVTAQMFANNYTPATSGNPLVVENPGTNDVGWCDLYSGAIVAGCQANQAYAQRTLDTWPATTNKYYAKNWTISSGSPAADTRLPSYASVSTAAGTHWTMNFTVAPNTSGLCISWEALAGTSGGSAIFSIDSVTTGTLNAYGNDGQTVQTAYIGSTWTVWTQCYPATPGVHKLDVVTTNASTFPLVAALAPTDPTISVPGSPRVLSMGVNYQESDAASANTAFYDTQKKNIVATLAGYGFPVTFGNVRAFTDLACDFTGTTYTEANGTVCTASTLAGEHPGNHGHLDNYRAAMAALNTYSAPQPTPLVIEANAPVDPTSYSNVNELGLDSSTGLNPGICYFAHGTSQFCEDLGYTTYAGLNTYMTRRFAPTGNAIGDCFYSNAATPTLQSNFTCPYVITPTDAYFSVNVHVNKYVFGASEAGITSLQTLSVAACTIASGSSNCGATITLPIAQADANYVATCSSVGGSIVTWMGNLFNQTSTTFGYYLIASATTGFSGGTVSCIVAHN